MLLALGPSVTLASGEMVGGDDVILAIPPSTWNRIGMEPALPAALTPQMGSNVKYLISLRNAFWRRAKVAPDSLSDGPINWTWHQTDGQKGVPVSMCAFSGGVAAETVLGWTAAQRRANYLRELGKSYPRRRVRSGRFMNWPADAWTRRATPSRAGQVRRHRCCARASTTSTSPRTSPSSAHGGASIPASLARRPSARRDRSTGRRCPAIAERSSELAIVA
jgi:monoamine oxidase